MREPVRYQNELLLDIVYKGCFTEFGAKHGFEKVKDYDSFTRQVPIRTYAEFFPWIERMRKKKSMCFGPASSTCSQNRRVLPVVKASISL